jgi:hypothetical protein
MTEHFTTFMNSIGECFLHFNTQRRAFLRKNLSDYCPMLLETKDLGYCFDELPFDDARNLVDTLIYFFFQYGNDSDTYFSEAELRRFLFLLSGQARQHRQLYGGLYVSLRSLIQRLSAHRQNLSFVDVMTDGESDYDSD